VLKRHTAGIVISDLVPQDDLLRGGAICRELLGIQGAGLLLYLYMWYRDVRLG
jgi:hypothetical protein